MEFDLEALGWQGRVVHTQNIVCHLGYPVGTDVDPQALLAWISARISDKFVYWKAQGWPMHVRVKVAQVIMLSMISYFFALATLDAQISSLFGCSHSIYVVEEARKYYGSNMDCLESHYDAQKNGWGCFAGCPLTYGGA